MKKCSKCGEEKEFSEFYKRSKNKESLFPYCKSCCKKRDSEYRKNNNEKLNKYKAIYRAKNKEAIAGYSRKYNKSEKGRLASKRNSDKQNKKYPNRNKAKNKFNMQVFLGNIKKPNCCSCCGIKCNPQAHHHDYLKPLDVTFFCDKCHKDWHKNNTPINRS